MNLQKFIDYRQNCPVCGNLLTTKFHSNRKQIVRYEDNRALFTFPLDGFGGKHKDHEVSYSFGLQDHSFCVEFISKGGVPHYHYVPDFLRHQFLDLHTNLKEFKFFRECMSCRQYVYSSQMLNINLKINNYEPLENCSESIGLSQQLEDGTFRIYQLINTPKENKSILCFWRNTLGYAHLQVQYVYTGATILELPLIPFVSVEETTRRLNNLVVFT
jgi:hypothetical protein